MRKAPFFYFIVFIAFTVLASCNNSDRAKKKIVDTITADFKVQNRNAYEKLDSIHIVSYDSLTQKKSFGITYDHLARGENLYNAILDLFNNGIQKRIYYLKTYNDPGVEDRLNVLLTSRQSLVDSLQSMESQMQELKTQYQAADSVQYYGFIVKAVMYITTMDATSIPYNKTIVIDKNSNVQYIQEIPPMNPLLDSLKRTYGL
ncbi:MAG TPA: hypothetical protein VN721_05645 [Flavipsychrobacter sp.]|nr:hypothetical protein [Flavipsychrobacter sp.]